MNNSQSKFPGQDSNNEEIYVQNGAGGYTAVVTQPETVSEYDEVGNLKFQVDGNGNTTYFYYDSRGLLTGKVDAAGYLMVNEYDAFGNLTKETL